MVGITYVRTVSRMNEWVSSHVLKSCGVTCRLINGQSNRDGLRTRVLAVTLGSEEDRLIDRLIGKWCMGVVVSGILSAV